jgi:16S rRNA (adenine1518-N6/adenine1519-N6)-dimethyltransferase
MNKNSPVTLNIQALLRQYGLSPSKGLGQNFLLDESILKDMTIGAGISQSDTVLEIGPGLGSLTRHLALAAGDVVAVELDQKLFPALEEILKPYPNVRLIQGDILKLAPGDLIQTAGYLVVANIPYYITSAVLRHLLASAPSPSRIVITVQKEIADRICATKKLSLLAVSVQVFGQPSIMMQVPADAFYPVPNVDSAVVRIDIHASPLIPPERLDVFFQLARAGFGQKRKTLRNSLSTGLHLPTLEMESLLQNAAIDPQRRAETISLQEWGKLTECYLAHRKSR